MTQTSLKTKGALLVLVLIFGAMFFVMISGFMGVVVTQSQVQERKYQQEQAREIAEAGLNYYKWFLAHNPDDTTNGTGTPGPYVMPYNDPELGVIGEYSLEISSSTYCGDVASIEIESTGYTTQEPSLTRTVYGLYARPTVAEYAYIINSNVWAGADRTIVGPYHSNNGIRMDGTNNSTVTSGQATWNCTSSYGCSPTNPTADGVVGSGPNSHLWTFPSTPINFTGLTVNLANMRNKAENFGGVYIPPSGSFGYRVDFQNDGTVDVYRVNTTYGYWGYSSANGWQYERNVINNDSLFATYTINPACPLIFVEDKVWLEGDVSTKVSLAAADTDTPGVDPSIILNGDITYTSTSSGLLAIAEDNVLVGLTTPNDMTLKGIFVAQTGRFGRNYYKTWGTYDVLSMHNSFVTRNSLTMHGTVVSNGRVGTKWTSGGTFVSGFNTRYNSYDRDLVNNPPPLAPNTSDDYKFVEWREMD
jgi:hypothetical protein